MAGCSTGIATAVVKAPNGKPSLLFQNLLSLYNGDIDQSYKSYLKSNTPRFEALKSSINTDENGELLASIVIEELQGQPGSDIRFSKDLGDVEPNDTSKDGTKKSDTDSVMSKLLGDAKLIIDPEVDEDGNQSDVYGITNTPGGAPQSFLGRVSNMISKFSLRKSELTDKAGNTYPTLTEAIVQREAEGLFKGKGSEERVSIEGIEYTKSEYLDFKRSIYKQGAIKGDLIHALLQHQIAFINGDETTMAELKVKINHLENLSSTETGSYNWVIEKDNFTSIMKNAGIEIDPKIPIDNRDKVYSEVSVANSLIAAGKIDTLVEKPNGRLKVVDYKTGNRFNNYSSTSRIMNYGSQEFDIEDSAIGRAKLQAMLYSVIVKANYPEALLDPPMIMHIPDEFRARSQRNAHQVEVRDYLRMIEQYYRNEKPDDYKALIEKSPKLFDPTEYGATRNTSFTQDMIDDKTGLRDDEMLTKYEVQLEQLVTRIALRGNEDDNYKGQWDAQELKQRDMLMKKISQAKTTLGLPQGSNKNYEIGKFTQWLGTINDTQNPYIASYSQIVAQARQKIYEEYGSIEAEFESKLYKVMEEKLGKRTGTERSFKPIDKQKFFEALIHEEIEEDPTDGQRRVRRGLITEKDSGWGALSQSEKDLVIYMRTQMKGIFNEVLVTGPKAVVSYKNNKPITKLDVYNGNRSAFKMTDSFIPKVAITSSEVRFAAIKKGLPGITSYIKHELAKRVSMFYEENVEGDNQKQYGIPVKYLGSGSNIHNPDIHTSNLEVAFKSYMQHMVNKKHYDTVYALGDSVKGFLELQKDANGNLINKNAADFVGYHMHRNLIGRIDDNGEGFWRKKFRISVSADGRDIYFSPIKFMRTLNSGVAAAALWLNIPSAAKNAGQAIWAVGKESMVNSMAATEWGGVEVDKQDLSNKNHARAYALWMNYQKESMLGRGNKHPVHVFMKTFRMFPDMTELRRSDNMVVDGGTALSTNHLSMMYSYPEELTTAVIAMDAMMTLKIQSGPYKDQSMWDVYANNIKVDEYGVGTFELPADFTRGKLIMGDGTLQELKGLNGVEIQKLHRIVQRVKGGYRTEERSMIEATALGEMFMLFRRWLPASIINGLKSKQYDYSMGYLAKTDQEDVFEWRARMTEGRWRTLTGVIGQYTGIAKRRGYQWADLSDMQRKNIIDASITSATMAVMSAITVAAFADADDEDSMKKWASEMNMRIIEQWNLIDMASAATQQPAAIKRVLEMMDGVAELGMASAYMAADGDEDDIYTKRGDLKGGNKIIKNLPISSAFYSVEKFIENSDYWQDEE